MTEADGVDEALADAAHRAADIVQQLAQLMLRQRETAEAEWSRQLDLIDQLRETVLDARDLRSAATEERTLSRIEEAEALRLGRASKELEATVRKKEETQQAEKPEGSPEISRLPKAEAERLHHAGQKTWDSAERRDKLARRLENIASKDVVQARLRAEACQAKPPSAALKSQKPITPQARPPRASRNVQQVRKLGPSR